MKNDILKSRTVFEGNFIRVHVDKVLLPNGKTFDKETIDRIDGVRVVPINKDKIIMIEQYIAGIGEYWLGLPGGGRETNGKIGKYIETPLTTAKREIWEETGYRARNWELLCHKERRGTTNQDLFYYMATDVYKGKGKRHIDETEPLKVKEVPLTKAIEMAYNLEFTSEATNLMIIAASKKLGR